MIIGIDHGYYAIKTRHCSFPAGLTCYGSHEPYTRQSVLEVDGQFYVCGTGRQPVRCDKTENDTYYLLTLAALAQEIKMRGAPNESSVKIAAGLPLTSFGRDKPKFRQYLLRSQPVLFRFEGTEYKIAVEDVALFPQGYAALLTDPDLLLDEPSLLLMDIGGWTVDLMRIDNARPVAETAHSLEFGMIRCIDAVREQVRRETGLSLTDAQIEQIHAFRRSNGRQVPAGREYRVEMNSPKLEYAEMEKLQEVVRALRHASAFVNDSCGMHVHIDAARHTPKSLKNLLSIMYSKEDILFAALKVDESRTRRWCRRVEEPVLQTIRKLPKDASMEMLKSRWYQGNDGSNDHYDLSRYHAVYGKKAIMYPTFQTLIVQRQKL